MRQFQASNLSKPGLLLGYTVMGSICYSVMVRRPPKALRPSFMLTFFLVRYRWERWSRFSPYPAVISS